MIAYKFHPDADAELEEASLFYESRMAGLGKSFAAEVERTISLLREFPEAGSPVGPKRRGVYRQDPDTIVIVAVAHQRRRPGYWGGGANSATRPSAADTSKLLLYGDPTLDFSLGDVLSVREPRETYLGVGVSHRSGVFGSSRLFGNVAGGSNYIYGYVETRF